MRIFVLFTFVSIIFLSLSFDYADYIDVVVAVLRTSQHKTKDKNKKNKTSSPVTHTQARTLVVIESMAIILEERLRRNKDNRRI